MQFVVPAESFEARSRVARLISRRGTLFFVLIALLYLTCFNGQWRIGLDSAVYRGLGDSLASGRGYTFGEWAPKHVYPGLPLLLAGLQKLFGRADWPGCAAMALMAAATLVVTYKLMRLYYPKWVAVTVTCGVATNSWFLRLSNEFLTDVPFLLGLATTLYGWGRLRKAGERRERIVAVVVLTMGLALAGVMRPTFWIIVVAGSLTCAIGLIRGPRKFHAICLVVMLVVLGALSLADPRARGFRRLSGGYERDVIAKLTSAPQTAADRTLFLLHDQFPAAFFGEQMALFSVRIGSHRISPLSIFSSLLVIAACALLFLHEPLWGMLVFVSLTVTVVYSQEPRYYVMVMPLLLLAWVLGLMNLCAALPGRWSEALLVGGLALVTLNNLSASVSFIKEQRSRDFLKAYRAGEWIPTIQMAAYLRDHLPADARVIGPSGAVMSYLSGRTVYTQRDIVQGPVLQTPQRLNTMGIGYVIMPARLYLNKEPVLYQMTARGIIKQYRRMGEAGGMTIGRMRVVIPPAGLDWMRIPEPIAEPPTRRKNPPRRPATTRKTPATKKSATTQATTRKTVTRPTTAATTRRTPATTRRKPATTRRSPATTRKSPATRRRPATTQALPR